MAILSDSEIKARISNEDLIKFADADLARECSYSFRPGKAFPVNKDDNCINFTDDPAATLSIKPGEMVWVRTHEQVKMPNDLVGFWWQTNSLSRLGLMLVNMSMVEPIYKGDLACLFVNFGDQIIVIESQMTIAKTVFFEIKGPVEHPYQTLNSAQRSHYDSRLLQLAINQPSSFLKIGEISTDAQREKIAILSEIENTLNIALQQIRSEQNARTDEMKQDLEQAKLQVIDDFKNDAPKMLLKSYGFAVLGLLFLGFAITLAGWFKQYAWDDNKKIARQEAERVVRDRLVIDGEIKRPEMEDIEKRLERLERAKNMDGKSQ